MAYEVRTEVVGEKGSAMIGLDVGLVRKSRPGHWGGQITPGFRERFGQAYDTEIQRWVDAVRGGQSTSTARGRGTATPQRRCARRACESLETGEPVAVKMVDRASIGGVT